jgi:DNA repair exonuclease SbcCD ATPase subunit
MSSTPISSLTVSIAGQDAVPYTTANFLELIE